jgi:hypothetical protein
MKSPAVQAPSAEVEAPLKEFERVAPRRLVRIFRPNRLADLHRDQGANGGPLPCREHPGLPDRLAIELDRKVLF